MAVVTICRDFGESFSGLWKLAIRGPLWSFSVAWSVQALTGPLSWGSSVFWCISHLKVWSPWGLSLCNADLYRETGYRDGSNPYLWLSSIALHPCLSGFPSQAFPTVNSSLRSPWAVSPVNSKSCASVGLQYLCPSSQPLHFLRDLRPCLGYMWLQQDCLYDSHSIQTVILIPFS